MHVENSDEEGTEGTIVTASMPNPVLSGSMISPSLLAFIMEKNIINPFHYTDKKNHL